MLYFILITYGLDTKTKDIMLKLGAGYNNYPTPHDTRI